MANTYTRAHRGKILQIMDRLKGKEHLIEITGGAPEDISHSYYLSDEQTTPDEHGVLGDPSTMADISWEMVPSICKSPSMESPRKLARRNSNESLHHDDYGDYHETSEQLAQGLIEDGHLVYNEAETNTKYPGPKVPSFTTTTAPGWPTVLGKDKTTNG